MAEKGELGVEIHGLYTTSYTPYGINICERLGFRTLAGSTTKLRSFELIVAKNNSFLVRPYQKAFEKWKVEQKMKSSSKNKRGNPR